MERQLDRLISDRFDLLVVGGGIHGLMAAYDAAQRGLSVALVERGDFGAGTSFNHLKTAHGGLRSLQTGNLRRAREGVHERRTLARIAPHLVRPLGFLLPTTRTIARGRLAFRAAFLLDTLLSLDRNDGVIPELMLPRGQVISAADCRRSYPGLSARGVTGGALWHDYQMSQGDRLTISVALAAAEHGACLANHMEVVELLRQHGRVGGARVRDRRTGEAHEIRGRIVLNAAGASAGDVMALMGCLHPFPLQKALNVVTTKPLEGYARAAPAPNGGTLIMMPWRGAALIGTWHADRSYGAHETSVTEHELERFIADANVAFPALRLTLEEIRLVHRGLVPAIERADGHVSQLTTPRLLDHARDGVEGAVTVVGVKYTTARLVAEQAVSLACEKLGRPGLACRTADVPLPGGDVTHLGALTEDAVARQDGLLDEEVVRRLACVYGTRYPALVELAEAHPTGTRRIALGRPLIGAEIVHAVRSEMAWTLVDVLVRRTGVGAAGHPGLETAQACTEVMAAELGWSEARVAEELAALDRFYLPVEHRPVG